MAEDFGLLPCPFCGDGESRIDESKMWTGMRYQLLSVTVIHWCNNGGIDGAVLKVTGPTQEQAIARWNARHRQ